MMREVRGVRVSKSLSHCFCLREVLRDRLRDVREVTLQVIENIAGGEVHFAAPCALYTTYIPRRLLGVARLGIGAGGSR